MIDAAKTPIFTYDSTNINKSGKLSISLTNPQNLSLSKSNIMIKIGGSECKIIGSTKSNQFSCQLPLNALNKPEVIAKNHHPEVHVKNIGYAIISPSIKNSIAFPYEITKISPNSVIFINFYL